MQTLKIQWDLFAAKGVAVHKFDIDSIRMRIPPDGGGLELVGVPGKLGGASWQEARYLVLDAVNHNAWTVGVVFGFWRTGSCAKLPDLTVTMGILPGVQTRLAMPLEALNSQEMFLERTPGRLKTVVKGAPLSVDQIDRFMISLTPSAQPQEVTLSSLELAGEEPSYPVPDQKLIDHFGQWKGKRWPGKVQDQAELVSSLKWELARRDPKGFPLTWSRCGGWREKVFTATGYFRTEHDGERWWLVDPYGFAFYSIGIDCVRPGEYSRVDGIEKLFAWLPAASGKYADAWRENGPTSWDNGSSVRKKYFSFAIANLIRVFGEKWQESWAEITRTRLKHWSFNTVGNWSSLEFAEWSQLPYVLPLQGFPGTKKKVFRDFPDVFAEEYASNAKEFANQLVGLEQDRNLIGYFLCNEPQWAFVDGINLAVELLGSEEQFASREALIQFLSEKYDGDVTRLNAMWHLHLSEFTDLRRPIARECLKSGQAAADLEEFSRIMIERYVAVPSQAAKAVDPHHLNLGMRWGTVDNKSLAAGSKYIDVFSFNCYQMDPTEQIAKVGELTGLPVLIGEFHFGALDRGLLATGLQAVEGQAERGKAYRYYVEQAAASPWCVGTHYFTLNDQPVLGSFDGENYQIGLVDCCQRPYEEFVTEVSAANAGLYEVVSGHRTPTAEQAKEIPKVGF